MKIRDCVVAGMLACLTSAAAQAAVPAYQVHGTLTDGTLPIETGFLPASTYKTGFSTDATILAATFTLESWLTSFTYDETGAELTAVDSFATTILGSGGNDHSASAIFISPGYAVTSWWENGNAKTATGYSNKLLFNADLADGYEGQKYYFIYAEVPEPATWAMMILGLGAAGAVVRHRRLRATA